MARLVFSTAAIADIDDIAAFSVEKFGTDVADAYLTGLEVRCEQLCEFPAIGAIYPRLRPATRCLIYRSHRIFYNINDDHVLIVRILHQSRDVETALN